MGLKAARRAGGDVLASPPGPIRPGDPFAVAGRKAIWPHLGRLLEIEGDLGDPARTDALRRYRVATRRLRVALRIFRDAYPKGETKAIRRRLSGLAEALGSVRDLDVRIQEIDHWAMDRGATDADAIRPLREALESRRAAALGELLAEIRRPAHARLMTALIAFVTATEPGAFGHPGAPGWRTADRAGSRIWEAFERVRSYAPAVREADLPTLHALRVDAKRLRYAVEFLGDVLGPERDWIGTRLVALQDHLGALNDASLAVAATRRFVDEQAAALTPGQRVAVLAYLADRERELHRLRRGVGRPWRPIAGTTFARKLARSLASGGPDKASSTGRSPQTS